MILGNILAPEFFDGWTAALWRASWQGAIAIGAVWIVCRCFPRLPPNLRCWLWRLALLKMVLAVAPWGSVDVPLLPSSWAARPPRDRPDFRVSENGTVPFAAQQSAPNNVPDDSPADKDDNVDSYPPVIDSPQIASSSPEGNELARNEPAENEPAGKKIPQARAALFAAWIAVVTVFLVMVVTRARGARRWRKEWRLIKDREILGLNELMSEELGLFQPPVLFEAESCLSPVVFGAVRTSIVLPSPLLVQSSPSQLRMILAHEMAHIRRGDLLGNWFSTFITGLFFFHPFVWLALRESRLAQEVACDELVSRQRDVSVADYGLLLLELATKYPRSATSLATVGVVESFHIFFKRRLLAMKYFRTNRTKSWSVHATSWGLVGIAVLGLLPWRLVAQSVPIVATPAAEVVLTASPQVPKNPFHLSEKSSESPFEKVEESPFKKVEESPSQEGEDSPFEPYKPVKLDRESSEPNQQAKNNQEPSETNRQPKNNPKPPEPNQQEANSEESSDDSPQTGNIDWSQSKEVSLVPPDTEWQVSPPDSPASEYRPKSVSLPAKTDFFEKLNGMAVSRVAKMAVVGYGLERHPEKTTRVILCDLQTGRATASASTPGLMAPLALHDDGRQILMCRSEFGFGNQDRLEIWTLQDKKIVRSRIWTPYEDERHSKQDVVWAEFIDSNRLATCSRGGKLAIWNLATGQPICHFQASEGAAPSLSPDRKWIAFAGNESLDLFDVEKQELIASQKTPRRLQWPAVAFSPSGRKIGCIAYDRILVWDTATGKLERDFAAPGLHIHGGIDFPDEDFILANNQFLVELQNQIKLWHYQGAQHVRTVGGTTFLAIPGDNRSGALLAAKLPHPEAAALLKKALQQPDLFVFHKGTPVNLDVSGIPDASQQAKVTESLTKKLGAMNCPVGASGDVSVVAVVEGPKSREVSYMHSGTYQVEEYFSRLKIVYQGKTLWEASQTNIPGFLHLNRGENIESVLRKASQKPSYEFYNTVVLPEFLQKPSDHEHARAEQTLGVSKATPEGLR